MSLISLIITLMLVGILLWAINTYIPMDPKIKNILNIVALIVIVLWLLQVFGVLGGMRDIRVGALEAPIGLESGKHMVRHQ